MSKELKDELARITRAQQPEIFRRDQHLVPTSQTQLNRLNEQLRRLAKLPMCKNQAE